MELKQEIQQLARPLGDATAVGITAGTLLKWLPAVAALFTIIWTGIRIYELVTGRPFSEACVAVWASKLLNKL